MTRSHVGRAAKPRRWIVGSIALITLVVPAVSFVPAATAQSPNSFVHVDKLKLTTTADGAVVTAQVRWDAESVTKDIMTQGDVRLVAVGDQDHQPTLLGRLTFDLSDRQTTPVSITVDKDSAAALRKGARTTAVAVWRS